MVARRPAVRLQLDARRQPGDLHARPRRHRRRPPDPAPRASTPTPAGPPTARSIAFATDRWGGLELASVRPDGTGVTRLTRSPGLDDYPAYSPDGKRLAFVSNRDGQFEVYVAAPTARIPSTSPRHPLARHVPDLDPRRPRRDVRLEPRRRVGPLHPGARERITVGARDPRNFAGPARVALSPLPGGPDRPGFEEASDSRHSTAAGRALSQRTGSLGKPMTRRWTGRRGRAWPGRPGRLRMINPA